jgi:hypothetical protein
MAATATPAWSAWLLFLVVAAVAVAFTAATILTTVAAMHLLNGGASLCLPVQCGDTPMPSPASRFWPVAS